MLAGYVTGFAIVGQLSTLAIMLHRGGNPQAWGVVLTVVAYLLLGTYIWRSVADLVGSPVDHDDVRTTNKTSGIM